MATKKTTEKVSGLGSGAMMFLETLSGGIQHAVAGVLDTIEYGTLNVFRKLLRSFGFFFFSVLGAVFLLIGIARVLDTVYQLPGLGEIIVGVIVFAGVLLFSMVDHQK
jgi:uncharacterized protein YggT (Ycf19 family)